VKRLPDPTSTTIFERMSRLAQARNAINLGQGFPDLPEPEELIGAAARALRDRPNQYPPMRGLPALRDAIAAYYARTQQLDIADDEIVVTSGATEALAATFLALVQPGDEVILIQPLYDAYLPLVERAGGVARFVDLAPPDWTLPVEALEAAISPRTRLIVLNTPNNPTGTVLDAATLEAVGALCERHDLTLLCDEVWEATLFDDVPHVSPMRIAALRERTVKVGSAGKIFSLTGWKVGWVCAAPPLAAAIAARHQYLTFTTAPALQWAVAEGLGLPTTWHDAHRARYAMARDRFRAGLGDAGYRVLPSSGTWFLTVDLAASGFAGDDVTLAERLIEEAGVASIPVSAFYAERPETGYLRLCFAKGDAMLDDAIERLAVFRRSAL
jgi:aspartate/methionine/tyrosine aminotransferase